MDAQQLRAICARELAPTPADYPWFRMSWENPNGDPDTELMKLFAAERPHHDSDEETVLVMCHG